MERSCRGHAEVMERSCRGHGEVMERSWRGRLHIPAADGEALGLVDGGAPDHLASQRLEASTPFDELRQLGLAKVVCARAVLTHLSVTRQLHVSYTPK